MDTIKLTRMAFFGYHGDEPEETKLGQRFTSMWSCILIYPRSERRTVSKTL